MSLRPNRVNGNSASLNLCGFRTEWKKSVGSLCISMASGTGACKGGETAAYDLHWQALAKKWDCALMSPSYHQKDKQNCRLWCDPRNGSHKTFLHALADHSRKNQTTGTGNRSLVFLGTFRRGFLVQSDPENPDKRRIDSCLLWTRNWKNFSCLSFQNLTLLIIMLTWNSEPSQYAMECSFFICYTKHL